MFSKAALTQHRMAAPTLDSTIIKVHKCKLCSHMPNSNLKSIYQFPPKSGSNISLINLVILGNWMCEQKQLKYNLLFFPHVSVFLLMVHFDPRRKALFICNPSVLVYFYLIHLRKKKNHPLLHLRQKLLIQSNQSFPMIRGVLTEIT